MSRPPGSASPPTRIACGEPGSYGFTFGARSGASVTWFAPVTPISAPGIPCGGGASMSGAIAIPGPPYGTGAGPGVIACGICPGGVGGVSGGQYGISHHALDCAQILVRVASAVACTMRNRMNGVISVTETPVVICGDAARAAY